MSKMLWYNRLIKSGSLIKEIKMIPIFDSKRQYSQIGEEAEKAVCEVMRSGCYILGPNVKAV